LSLEGTNLLEATSYTTYGFIHLPKGTALTIDGGSDGDGVLYGYKYSQGAGIGGGTNEAGGALTIESGHIFIKGSKTGPLIGGDAGMTASTVGIKNDDVTIAGGEVVLINKATGQGIGGGNKSADCAGTVYITGGNVTTITDFTGAAIGGDLIWTGGSFKMIKTGNAIWQDRTTSYQSRVAVVGAMRFDTAVRLLEKADYFEVYVDDELYYTGGLHRYYYNESSVTAENFAIATPESTYNTIHGSGSYYDTNLYFMLSHDSAHTLVVNGEKFIVTPNATGGWDYERVVPTGEPGSGDIDGDGLVTMSDITQLVRVILELDAPTDGQTLAVDMDDDGRLTMADVVLVIHKLLGI
jgi:hypothetical protein